MDLLFRISDAHRFSIRVYFSLIFSVDLVRETNLAAR